MTVPLILFNQYNYTDQVDNKTSLSFKYSEKKSIRYNYRHIKKRGGGNDGGQPIADRPIVRMAALPLIIICVKYLLQKTFTSIVN